ncbi:endothelin-converting enzyme 2-like [Cloeon dipterum]|uniref:endothelin-converting enzyme 2-like n=1 Tax=Cloeon dipterum TaxID=197152 RepID=UPI0032209B92
MDTKVDPCDDFYAYSCGGWIKNNFVPDGASRIDEFQILSELTMYKIKGAKVNSKQMAKDLLTFQRQLKDIMTKSDAEEDQLKQFQQITLNQLQTITNSNSSTFVWLEYFNDVLSGLKDKLDKNSPIILRNGQYFEQWPQIMRNTNPETIELYIWWRIFSSLAPHTITEFREMREKLMQKMSGNRDLVIHRWKTCVEMVNKAYGMTMGSAYTQKHFDASIKNEVVKIKDEIRNAIEDTLKKQDWMDEQTINLSLDKIRATEIIIGVPKEPQNSGEQNEFYPEAERMNIEILNKGFFEANLQLLAAFEEHKLRLLSEITQRNRKNFFSPPTDVNVFYNEETNLITLPAAILQHPFYNLGLDALNYGAIGALIAQQYIHAIDNIGRQYDLNGNLNQSWSEETLTAYNERSWCPVDQQNGFNRELPRGKFSLIGKSAQAKNVAGVDGLREALKAFKNLQYKLDEMIVARNVAFPALEQHSEEHLFFLAFANMFCSREYKSTENSHNRLRVINTVSNMGEFSDLWNCRAGSKMNPVVKCTLW